jgi:hypothetical protein
MCVGRRRDARELDGFLLAVPGDGKLVSHDPEERPGFFSTTPVTPRANSFPPGTVRANPAKLPLMQ